MFKRVIYVFVIICILYIILYVWLRNESILNISNRGWGNKNYIYANASYVSEDGSPLSNQGILKNHLTNIAYYIFFPAAMAELRIKVIL